MYFIQRSFCSWAARKGRLIVGSANTTAAGLAGNLELVGLVECNEEPGPEQSLIASAWAYSEGILDTENRSVAQQLSWMQARVPWLHKAAPASDTVELPDGTLAAFFATNDQLGILERFVRAISGDTIERIIVLSPYWDAELAAVNDLAQTLGPSETILLIDKDRALFPVNAFSDQLGLRLVDIGDHSEGRFVHAKLIIAQSTTADHVLFGSANCTIAALGRENYTGSNEEACLYRRVSRHSVSEALGLDELIGTSDSLQVVDIPPFKVER